MPDRSNPLPSLALDAGPGLPFPELAARYLEEYRDKIRLAVEPLTEEELWWRPAEGTNSAGNLLLHLEGNLSLWILQGVGGREFVRDRAGEFAARAGSERAAPKAELLERLGRVVAACREALEDLGAADLTRPVAVQTYRVDVLGAVFHAVEHMGYHAGQIVWIAKQARPGRLEFYPHHAGE